MVRSDNAAEPYPHLAPPELPAAHRFSAVLTTVVTAHQLLPVPGGEVARAELWRGEAAPGGEVSPTRPGIFCVENPYEIYLGTAYWVVHK